MDAILLISCAQSDLPRAAHHCIEILGAFAYKMAASLSSCIVVQVVAASPRDESAQLRHTLSLTGQSKLTLLGRSCLVVPEHGRWREDCCGEAVQRLLEALRSVVISPHLIVKLELADEVNLLFHEFCLDQVS